MSAATVAAAQAAKDEGQAYRLGDRVTFTRTLTRRFRPAAPLSRKVWETEGYPGQPEPAPRDGVIVGRRTLADGRIDSLGWEGPVVFIAESRFTAYLVAFDLHRRPVLVLPEHLRPAKAEEVTR